MRSIDVGRHGFLGACIAAVILIGCTRQVDTGATAPLTDSQQDQLSGDSDAAEAPSEIASARSNRAQFAGTQSCAECHQEIFDSYSATSHARSLRRADPSEIPTGVTLNHAVSKRSYDVVVEAGKLRHVEWEHFVPRGQSLQPSDPKLKLADLPVAYVMGSGSFAEAYLLRDGDYLLQSPVTWYDAEQKYAMAPGYDEPVHRGCNRVIEARCLFCHVGQITRDTPQHPAVSEMEIGCERCHGPSQSHVAFQQVGGVTDHADPSGVNAAGRSVHPGKLDRTALDSICAQCHLGGDIVVDASGKTVWDFVPGEDLADTRLVYRADDGDSNDPFSMHFDQFWNSPCYLGSESLTCVTCHDPHHAEPAGDVAAFYREKCLQCHQDDACGVPRTQRVAEQQNQCVKCHMPASASAAVHSATTHHRIGIHRVDESKPTAEPIDRVRLRLIQPRPANLSDQELALANVMAEAYWLLEYEGDPVKTRGLDAAAIEQDLLKLADVPASKHLAMLARLAGFQANQSSDEEASRRSFQRAAEYASRALGDPAIGHDARVAALEVLARQQYHFGEFRAAAKTYNQLVSLRRSAIDLYNLGLVQGKLQDFVAAEQAFRRAVEIDPSYPLPYRSLSKLYRLYNNAQMAAQMENIANTLIMNQQ